MIVKQHHHDVSDGHSYIQPLNAFLALHTATFMFAVFTLLASTTAYASTVDVYGLNGSDNSSGVGGNGQDIILSNSIATDANSNPGGNLASVQSASGGYGGGSVTTSGGNGGLGSSSLTYTDTTAAQVHAFVWGVGGGGGWGYGGGGSGGNASSALNITASSAASVFEQSIAEAGSGGSSFFLTGNNEFNPGVYLPAAGDGGAGGNATASASGITSSASTLTVNSTASGGYGGQGNSLGFIGGMAGTATASASGIATNGATVSVYALQSGGNGGDGGYGADGANGADSIMTNAVSGSTSGHLTLTQMSHAGNGGEGANGGNGGNATSMLSLKDHSAQSLTGFVYAYGGTGFANMFGGTGGVFGDSKAQIRLTSTVSGSPVNAVANAGLYTDGNATAKVSASGVGIDTSVSSTAIANGSSGSAGSSSSSKDGAGNSVHVYAHAPINNGVASALTQVGANANSLNLTSNGQAIASGYTGTYTTPSLNTANGNFTVIGSGNLGAISNGGAGSYDYITKANYVFTPPSGNELFLNMNSSQFGTGFESATLTVTANNHSILTSIFSSYASFLSFLSIPTDLGSISGTTSIGISLVEALAGLGNGHTVQYQLAMAETGTVTGQFRTVSSVPLPNSLIMFVTALLGMAGYEPFRRRRRAQF